ncbi:MAG TPA: hypothetical protein VNC50_04695, partial [Planctomycetia bacterium]|nr:hypothetical protein [Planctomycetia bacterium]
MNVALACTLACVLFAVPDAELLKSKGLKLSAGVYVVAEEGELQKGLADLRPLQKALATAQKEANALKRELEDNEKIIPQLVAQNRTLRAQLNQAENNTAVYNRIIGQINNNNEAISERQRAASDPDYGKETRAKLAAAREGYMNKLLAMRVAIDKGRKKYEEFAKEDAIGKAIAAVGSEAEKEYALGPSKNFERNVKALEKLE